MILVAWSVLRTFKGKLPGIIIRLIATDSFLQCFGNFWITWLPELSSRISQNAEYSHNLEFSSLAHLYEAFPESRLRRRLHNRNGRSWMETQYFHTVLTC